MLSSSNSKKYVVLNFADFTIMQFELHSPSASKSLMVHGHGRLRSTAHQISNTGKVLHFYTARNTPLLISEIQLRRFQNRSVPLAPVESIQVGGDSPDYEVAYSSIFQDRLFSWLYYHPLINRKPAINLPVDLGQRNYHDVLTVKPGRVVPLSWILMQVPSYREVHCMICRNT